MRRLPTNFHKHTHGQGSMPMPFLMTPGLSVLALVRQPLGYDMTDPITALKRAGGLIVLPYVFVWLRVAFTNRPPAENTGLWWLTGFAVLSFVATCIVHVRRMTGQKRGQEVHELEAGWSLLSWYLPERLGGGTVTRNGQPEPPFLTEIVLVPALFAAAGLAFLYTVSQALGYWLLACSLSLLLISTWERRRFYRGQRATVDGMIEGQTVGARVDAHAAQARGHQARHPAGEPEFAELYDAPAPSPDAATFRPGEGELSPAFMTWRKRRAGANTSAAPQGETLKAGRARARSKGQDDYASLL